MLPLMVDPNYYQINTDYFSSVHIAMIWSNTQQKVNKGMNDILFEL